MKKTFTVSLCCSVLMTSIYAFPLYADESGASERIALAGELRTLSQRVASASCFLHAGLEPDSSRTVLLDAKDKFRTITAALEFGDPALGVNGAEDRRRTLAGIAKLNELWAPIEEKANAVVAGASTDSDINALAAESMGLLDVANRLVVQLTSQYSGQTSVLHADAVRLDIAGRQRTLAQEIAKNGCLISSDIDIEASTAALGTAANNFEVSMNALRLGLEEVGILPPPNAEISESLDEVARNWSFMSDIAANLAAGEQVDDVTLGVMFLMSNQVTDNMAGVVDQYSAASKIES